MGLELKTREAAVIDGGKRYFTGFPCRNGHVAERQTSNATCFVCASDNLKRRYAADSSVFKERNKRYHDKNKSKVVANVKAWSERNKNKVKAAKLRYSMANKAKIAAKNKIWELNNKAAVREKTAKRRAVRIGSKPLWYGEFDSLVMREAAALCDLRKAATGIAWQVDHMIPLQAHEACGLHCADNLQVIPAYMNSGKCNKMILTYPGEWISCL